MSLLQLRTMSIRQKLFVIVVFVCVLVGVLLGTNRHYSKRIDGAVGIKDTVYAAQAQVLEARIAEKSYLQYYNTAHVGQLKDCCAKAGERIQSLLQKGGAEKSDAGAQGFALAIADYQKSFDALVDINRQRQELAIRMKQAFNAANKSIEAVISTLEAKAYMLGLDGEKLSGGELALQGMSRDAKIYLMTLHTLYQEFLATGEEQHLATYKKVLAGTGRSAVDTMDKQAKSVGLIDKTDMLAEAQAFKANVKSFDVEVQKDLALFEGEKQQGRVLDEAGVQINAAAEKMLVAAGANAEDARREVALVMPTILLVCGAGWLVFVLGIVRSITGPVKDIFRGLATFSRAELAETGDQFKNIVDGVTRGSVQIAAASQELAANASRQASSLEETSASLEQMSSMTRQNAGHAQEADQFMQAAGGQVKTGLLAMNRMSQAIDKIQTSATETAKIIKTIDEIAFQTNLLALNAAVEAARAGEAGKGFAVVAEEVRNLARRSAEAAKNTASLIEGAQKNASEGVAVAADVAKNLDAIRGSVDKVGALIQEIAQASKEQSQGIEQVNKAVSEMDQVVQLEASSSEESSAAADELAAQARELNAIIGGQQEDAQATPEMAMEKVNDACALIEQQGKAAFARLQGRDSGYVFAGTYVWVNDMDGIMLMHPTNLEMVGQDVLDIADSNGKKIFSACIDVCRRMGSGWVEYLWPKPGEHKPSPKISFVKKAHCDGREVVVGCGIYNVPERMRRELAAAKRTSLKRLHS